MDTLAWLLKHSFKGVITFILIFIAVFIFKFFVPQSVKDAASAFFGKMNPGFSLPAPGSLSINGGKPAPTPGSDDDTEAETQTASPIANYFGRLSTAPGSLILPNTTLQGTARGTFFSKDTGGFQVLLLSDKGTQVMTTRAKAEGNLYYVGFVPWSARIPYFAYTGPCKLIFKKDEEITGYNKIKTIYTELPMVCGAKSIYQR